MAAVVVCIRGFTIEKDWGSAILGICGVILVGICSDRIAGFIGHALYTLVCHAESSEWPSRLCICRCASLTGDFFCLNLTNSRVT